MITLLFDTSTERAIVALFKNDDMIFSKELPVGLQNSKYLVPTIEESLKSLNLKPQDLGRIVCGVGPGSYTGLRVAASVAKSLAYALNIPLIGVSALQAFIPDESVSFASIIDAKMGGLYASFDQKNPQLIPITTDLPGVCVSPWTSVLKNKFPGTLWIERAPDPQEMFRLAKASNEPFSLLYLQEWKPQG